MKTKLLATLALSCLLLGCQPTHEQIRDVLAVSKGTIDTAIEKYFDTCLIDSLQEPCIIINKAALAHNTLDDSLQFYCQFDENTAPDQQCQPIKSYEDILMADFNQFKTIFRAVEELVK